MIPPRGWTDHEVTADAHGRAQPECLPDLLLDTVVAAITRDRAEYDLTPLFYAPLRDPVAVTSRQATMRDLERIPVRQAIEAFSSGMREARLCLKRAETSQYPLEQQRWFLGAAERYVATVRTLDEDLDVVGAVSDELSFMRSYVGAHVGSTTFAALARESAAVAAALATVRYTVRVRGNRVTVQTSDDEPDLTASVERTFERFRTGDAQDYRVRFRDLPDINRIEAEILARVARLNPNAFDLLAQFREAHATFIDDTLTRFEREMQFHLAYLSYIEPLRRAGLSFCYPELLDTSSGTFAEQAFDLALAHQLAGEGRHVVTNSFALSNVERILVVTGPNQGGKTTFARMVGQLHWLTALGCAVPGTAARLKLCDGVFTHFEQRERGETLRGKLKDDLVRIHAVLDRATPSSVIILNEIFSSTTAADALLLSRHILTRILRLDALAVCVTFLDELARLGPHVVSLVVGVQPGADAVRTFKVIRAAPTGLAYALALAEKHGVTGDAIRGRIAR